MNSVFGTEVPKIYDTILSDIQEVEPRAIIAGGALRDLVLGGMVKDIDIFIPDYTENKLLALCHHLYDRGYVSGLSCQLGDYLKLRGHVSEWFHDDCEKPIQVIFKIGDFEPIELLGHMDFGACQIAYYGHGSFIYTSNFLADMALKKITLLDIPNETESRRSARRARSFKERYRDTAVRGDVSLGLCSEWPEHYID